MAGSSRATSFATVSDPRLCVPSQPSRADTPIGRLRRVAAASARGEPAAPEDAAWFVAAIQRYQAECRSGAGISLDMALGLGRHGSNGWWTVEARDRRNDLIRKIRHRHFAHLDDGQAARHIAAMARNHDASPFRQRQPVAHDPDSLEALLHAALCTTCGFPDARQLKAIIRKS